MDTFPHAQVMFGTISAFFWKHLAGITATSSGYRTVRIAPSFGELCGVARGSSIGAPASATAAVTDPVLTSLDASLDTVAGVIRVQWEAPGVDARAEHAADGGVYTEVHTRPGPASLKVTVPRGTSTAEIVMPCVAKAATITDGLTGAVLWTDGRFAVAGRPARVLSGTVTEFGGVSFTVRSGSYQLARTTSMPPHQKA